MDLHPEELLEREASGELGASERERLDVHLRHCPACRLERRARVDFHRLADRPGPDVRALIANTLLPERPRGARARARPTVIRLRVALVAAALLGFGGLAAAASGWPQWRMAVLEAIAPGRQLSAQASAGAPRLARSEALPPTALPSSAAAPDTAGAVSPAEGGPLDRPMPSEPPGPAIVRTATARAPSIPAAPLEDAASLFDEANAARRRGDHGAAAATYRRLLARYPRSGEARESPVVLGRMLLDDGDAANALGYFDGYVSRGGPLTAEAMLGRALALRQLGRADQERDAWTALAAAYPDSVHARRATARLAELGR
jgi:TolA-binding protein